MNTHFTPAVVYVLMTQLNGNMVITTLKVASTWLLKNYYTNEVLKSDEIIDNKELANITSRYRNMFNIPFDITNTSNYLKPNPPNGPNDELNSILKSNHDLFEKIKTNNSGILYILYRHPEDRYLHSILEDINYFIETLHECNRDDVLNFYLSFITNSDSDLHNRYTTLLTYLSKHNHLKNINDLVNTLSDKPDNIKNNLITIILDGIINWFMVGFDYSTSKINTPFNELTINKKLMEDRNNGKHIPWYPRNVISSHYKSYLTPMWYYYNSLGQPDWIRFLDIDDDDIDKIILNKDTSQTDNPNKTPSLLKKKWNESFYKYILNNKNGTIESISKQLLPDVLIYNMLKNKTNNI
jgi:hypothetical protein